MAEYNVLVAGVGGQGNLSLGGALAQSAVLDGLEPTIGETFGASRRGGSVVTHLRIGNSKYGPLIPRGRVDLLIGLEPVETLRAALDYCSNRTTAVMSVVPVHSMETLSANKDYPSIEAVVESLELICGKVYTIDPSEDLQHVGDARALNSFMVGIISVLSESPLSQEGLRTGVQMMQGNRDTNLQAYDLGRAAAMEADSPKK